jgi:hypothetical protein
VALTGGDAVGGVAAVLHAVGVQGEEAAAPGGADEAALLQVAALHLNPQRQNGQHEQARERET